MTRLEMLLWTLAVAALAWPSAAKAQTSYYYQNPASEAFSMSVELGREANALAYDARTMISDRHDRNEVLDELEDVMDELEDLNKALHDAIRDPRRWDCVAKRAEDVLEDIEDLDKDVHEAVEDMNRYNRTKRPAFVPINQPHYRTNIPQPGTSVTLRIGNSSQVTFSKGYTRNRTVHSFRNGTLPPPPNQRVQQVPQVYSPIPTGNELLNHVHLMQALAQEIHRVAHQ
ncbi:hypothetical protein [Aeoliella mucimassa]|uniref:Uncharacterized protein n=1 Tax=Aeoliella mucimassa TaxID=2527972 RepID=A0A518AQY8_9BACT|nr:hypothetical protein [Aeoliella mucimassa]QDU57142.1 hypothetical protein Pan181_33560 [Aeoliella mucimassa]